MAGDYLIYHGADIEAIAYGGTYIKTSSGFIVDSVGDMGALPNVGDTQRYASLVSANSSGYFDNLLVMGRRDSAGAGWSHTSLHLIDKQTGSTTDPLMGVQPKNGAAGGDLTYNVPGYNGSIGIGTISADAKSTVYAMIAAAGMQPLLPLGAQFGPGQTAAFVPDGGDGAGHVSIHPVDANTIEIRASNKRPARLDIDELSVSGAVIIPYGTPAHGAACISGQIVMDDDNDYACHAGVWTYQPKGNAW